MPFRPPFLAAGERFIKNKISCRIKINFSVIVEHHGDDVCGGGGVCVDRRRNSCTVPIVGNLWGGSFSFPPEPIGVKLLTIRGHILKT
jgi:hypothetical protein